MNSLAKQPWWRIPANLTTRLQSSAVPSTNIEIPKRIERSPTDILTALSYTIPKAANTKHYNFQWDPYLCPLTNRQRRDMALSFEAGRKAALWVKQEHGPLFPKDISQPEIKQYNPPEEFEGTDKITEDYLVKLISCSRHKDALRLYKLLNKDEVSTNTKLSLLELLCFHAGSGAQPDPEFQAAKWFIDSRETINMFNFRGELKELFESLIKQDEKTVSHAYSTMICAAAFHRNAELTNVMYNRCIENRIPLNRDAYKGVLSTITMQKKMSMVHVKEMQDICATMTSNGVKADIHVYNTLLQLTTHFEQVDVAVPAAKSIFQEIRSARLEPTLATYSYMLTVFERSGELYKDELREVLMMAASKTEYKPSHKDDFSFFPYAMKQASNVLNDLELGELIHETLLTGDNYKFLGSAYKEMMYYRQYLLLVLATKKFEQFEEFYDKIVPHVYQVETMVIEKIIDALQVQPAEIVRKYCLKHWHDLMTFYPRQSESTTNRLLFLMSTKCELSNDSPLHEQFSNAAWDMWSSMQAKNAEKFSQTKNKYTAGLLSDILVLLLRGQKYDKLIEVLTFINRHAGLMHDVMMPEKINEIFTKSLEQGDTEIVFLLLDYVMNNDVPGLHAMVKKTRATLSLSPAEETKLAHMVAPFINSVTYQSLQQTENLEESNS